jgi:beta-glucosidase-like glycosyl hydrolase
LNGDDIENNIDHYLALARKGVAGFIVFGGEIEALRKGINRLQEETSPSLLIMSDLEQGLGQQVKGGTLFPPAMALGSVDDVALVCEAFDQMVQEAAYVGINTILAPVLDINTNPRNPIISTRAFGENPEIVSELGSAMIKSIQNAGLMACGKHFPGHGNTGVDSHLSLPHIDKTISELEGFELEPFRHAIEEGIMMIMLGHLNVLSMSPSGIPVSISKEAVEHLRNNMGFNGLIITDAMNMGAVGAYAENEASLMALKAGVNIILHPSDPEGLAQTIEGAASDFSIENLMGQRQAIPKAHSQAKPSFNAGISDKITEKSIIIKGSLRPIKDPYIILLNDDESEKGTVFIEEMNKESPSLRHVVINAKWQAEALILSEEVDIIVCVFSSVKAYKGGTATWITQALEVFQESGAVLVSFGNPYLIDSFEGCARVYAWWGSEMAQRSAARALFRPCL